MSKRTGKTSLVAAALAVFALVASCSSGGVVEEAASESPTVVDELRSHWSPSQSREEFLHQAVIYEVNLRQFSEEGTFAAVTRDLPRLSELGVDILWLMPIHPISEENRKGSLGSPYAVADYLAVNPDYGTEEDLRKLIDSAHDRNMMVILDWVANHTGWDNPWIVDHPEWYTTNELGEIIYPEGTDWWDVADLDYSNLEMREAMADAMAYWVEEFDVDGYRADVAGGVPIDFWEPAIARLRDIKDVFMLAEDGFDLDLLDAGFDTNYAWSLLGVFSDLAENHVPVTVFRQFFREYRDGKYQMLFITNHDENSWAGTVFDRYGKNVRNLALIYFTLPGMPLIYDGQEIGLDRQLEFFEKDPIDWPEGGNEWTEYYRMLIELRDSNPALWSAGAGGQLDAIKKVENVTGTDVFAFSRSYLGNDVIVIANPKDEAQSPQLLLGDLAGEYTNFFSGENILLLEEMTLTVEAHDHVVFVRESS
jgi:1,4-alpha-glucan branching enzyme